MLVLAAGNVRAPGAATPADKGPLVSLYRGSTNLVARTPWGELTEAQLYLYMIMSDAENPLLVESYLKAGSETEGASLRGEIEKVIRAWALTQALASEVSGGEYLRPLGDVRTRMLMHPIHELVWIDRCLIPQVKVVEQDVRKYYSEHPEIALEPPRARVRYILLQAGAPLPDEAGAAVKETHGLPPNDVLPPAWVEARKKMERIVDEILTEGLPFEEAARRESDAPSAADGGLIPEFNAGSYFPEFEKYAFEAEPGHLGPVFLGPGGVYLLRGEPVSPRKPIPLETVEGKIREKLYFEQLRQRCQYELSRLRRKDPIVNRAAVIDAVDPRARILRAGRLDLSREEVWDLFPGFVTEGFALRKWWLQERLARTGDLELLARRNEREGWDADPRLVWARGMALTIQKAEWEIQRRTRPRLRLTPAEVSQFFQNSPQAMERITRPRFSLIQVQLADPQSLSEPHRRWRMERMRRDLEKARDAYTTRTIEQLAAEWPVPQAEPAALVPAAIERELRRVAGDAFSILRWPSTSPLSDLPDEDTRVKALYVQATFPEWVAKGIRFPDIDEMETRFNLFYVDQPDYSLPATFRLIRSEVYRAAAQAITSQALREIRTERLGGGQLGILLP
jgi:hypothetical protein